MISDPIAVLVVLAAVVVAAVWLAARVPAMRALGAALVAILLAMALSNAGVLTGVSPTYDWLSSWGVSLAVALILMRVDVHSVIAAGPRMLAAFSIGAVSTALGAIAGAMLWSAAVGPETWKLAGQFTGTYTGGGMNFAALGRALGTSSDLFSAAVAADVALTAIWMVACLTAPLLLRNRNEHAVPPSAQPSGRAIADTDTLERALTSSIRPVALIDLASVMAIAVGAVWAAGRLATLVPALPEILWLSTIVLAVAHVPAVRRLTGSALLGNYLLLMFLAANGAQSVIANIFRVGPAVFWFALTTLVVHGLGIFGIGRLFGIDAGTLAVASQANVGGPASAVALASARGYGDRLLPGVAVGLLGYAVGNYLGFGVASLVRGLLGG